jgi:hypothetical protein
MALNPNEIHVSPARIYIDVTPPASGTPPTWLTHTNGVPATGTEVGLTAGEAVFTWATEKADIESEQVMGIVDKFITRENAQLEFEAQERTYALIKRAFDNIGSVNDATRLGFYGGGGGTIINIQYATIALVSLRRDIAARYEVLLLYKCVCTSGMLLRYSRTTPSTYRVTFQALPDTTRSSGDQIFQFSREKA